MGTTIKKNQNLPEKVFCLLKKGVRMTAPFSVEIGEEVDLGKISPSLAIYGAARIYGRDTLISSDVKLGYESPVTLIDCRLGAGVELRGGYFEGSVFLDRVRIGSGAQVRSGCLLEEESGGNHCVGLKQTILFPFVQLGSLINFCDCLMAGGTSRKDHSEVGSSYIHFNYTPKQDKATASLIGDVPRGVMLRERPVFLGGQGGLVGPVQIDYGTVIPAGIICRKEGAKQASGRIRDKIFLNMEYIANLAALKQWYLHVRRPFFAKDKLDSAIYQKACGILDGAVKERIKQLELFADGLETSLPKKQFEKSRPVMESYLADDRLEAAGKVKRDAFIKIIRSRARGGTSYLEAIKSLTPQEAAGGTSWLKDVTGGLMSRCAAIFQSRR